MLLLWTVPVEVNGRNLLLLQAVSAEVNLGFAAAPNSAHRGEGPEYVAPDSVD